MNRYICIHGHFYQPPRENPWLEEVELQEEAYPFHDWNERIDAECYSQNAASRVLDREGKIARIANNYSHISFNFGPTLLSWLERKDPDTYSAILAADRESLRSRSGHGSAIAQAYNHIIFPLASLRDRETQLIWGVEDFKRRFERPPEGVWLPETAIDEASFELLAALGIKFTILAPHQAARIRQIGTAGWKGVQKGELDTTRAYLCSLPSGKQISLFFFDDRVARAVAFEGILASGDKFAQLLVDRFDDRRGWNQLVNIATDGESYGHHHRFGDMALAYALWHIEENGLAKVTNYGEFLEQNPPTHEVEIVANTSWSCPHGVERWRADCGCNSGAHPGWNQRWRAPLRGSLDWLRQQIDLLFEKKGGELLRDPWQARDEYIQVLLDRSDDSLESFLKRHSAGKHTPAGDITRLKLLELQRHAMLMYTSCGWFFDDITGIETVQVIAYAGRTLQLGRELFGDRIEEGFLKRLAEAKSNIAGQDGRTIYEQRVKPAMLDLPKVGAHYAVSSLFEEFPEEAQVYCYRVALEDQEALQSGRVRLNVGRGIVRSAVTRESSPFGYAALHLGDHNVAGGVSISFSPETYRSAISEIVEAFGRADTIEIIRLFDRHFAGNTFSLRSLFRDERRRFLDLIMKENIDEADALYLQIYDQNAPVMRYLTDLGIPIPAALQLSAERALNFQLQSVFEAKPFDLERAERLLEEARERRIMLDGTVLGHTLRGAVERMARKLKENPADLELLGRLADIVGLIRSMPFEVNLWRMQNIYYRMVMELLPEMRGKKPAGDKHGRLWLDKFLKLGEKLKVRVEGG